jgi:PEP-CTERM motif
MRRCGRSVLALLVPAVLLAPAAARADIITPLFFDNFEADAPDVLNSTLLNWNVTSGAIDVLSSGNICGSAGDPSRCVDLDGTGKSAGTIQSKQSFTLDPGLYRLTFDLAGANRIWTGSASNTVTVSLGGYFSEDFTLFRYDPFQTFTRDINVGSSGPVNIVFNHHGADWIGLLLDNVSLSNVVIEVPDVIPDEPDDVIPTPEPGTWQLIAPALGLLAWRFRKKLV